MAYNGKKNLRVYGFDGLQNLQNKPIIANRAPTTADSAEIGDTWINKTTNSAYTLVNVSAGSFTWVTSPASGVGTFTDVAITPGDLTVAGDVTAAGKLALSGAAETHAIAGNLDIAGDLDVTGVFTFTGDLDLTSAALIDLTSTLDALCIYLRANGGTSEQIKIHSDQGTGVSSLYFLSDVGGLTLQSGLASDDAINLTATAGGLDFDAAKQINIATSETDADSFVMTSAGGMDIVVTGALGKDFDLTCTSGSINIIAGEAVADAVIIEASHASGGLQIKAGTNGIKIGDEVNTPVINLGNAAPTASRTITIASGVVATAAVTDTLNIGTGAATTEATAARIINLGTGTLDTGTLTGNIFSGNVTSGTHAVNVMTGTGTKTFSLGNADGLTTVNIDGITLINDSINVNTSIGTGTSTGDIALGNAAAGDITLDSAAGISLDAGTASNFTAAVGDLSLGATTGSVVIDGAEAVADAIQLTASDVAGGITAAVGTGGYTLTNTGALSLAGAAASDITITGAFDLTHQSTAGSVILDGGEAVADAVQITASDIAGGITLTSGTGGITSVNTGALSLACTLASDITCTGSDLTLESVGASVNLAADEAANDAIALDATAGGFSINGILQSNVTVTGAGEDLNLMAVGGSVYIDGSEAVTNAVRIISTGVGGGIDIDSDTGGLFLDSAGTFSIDGVAASNVTTTGAGIDLTLSSAGGSVLVQSTEAVATAIRLYASDPAGGISIEGDGLTNIEFDNQTIASPTVAATTNTNKFQILATGFTTAAAATEVFTITNSLITTSSYIIATACNEGANDAQMTITRVNRAAGSVVITVTNNGAAALNGNLAINVEVNN